MAAPEPELSVVIPAYNEGRVLRANIEALRGKLDSLGLDYEVIIVNDGSSDNTAEEARKCVDACVHVVSYARNRGKGYAVREGMKHANGAYKMFMDADLSTSLDEIEKFLGIMRHYKFDVLIGNRRMDPSLQTKQQPLYRRFFGKGFTLLSSVLIGRYCADYTCGFKMFRKAAADTVFKRQRIDNWAFDTELIAIALAQRLAVHEVPVVWHHAENSKVRLVREIITSLAGLVRIRTNALLGRYR